MTQEMQTGSYVAGVYPYDGVGGELIGEYAANGSASTPQKEYGYRNGQLLITATVTSGSAASAFSFTDAPIVAGTTTIKALHLTELRTAVDQARVHAGLFFLAG